MWQIIVNGPRHFETTVFLPEGITTLGRAAENDIVLTGTAVSRDHAQLEVRGENLYVVDLGSRNGCEVNGSPLKGTALLQAGDTVTLGENTLLVRRPAKVENAFSPNVDLKAGGVRRVSPEVAALPAVMGIKRAGASRLLKALDARAALGVDGSSEDLPHRFRLLVSLQGAAEQVDSAATLQAFLDACMDWARETLGATAAVTLLRHPSGLMVPVSVKRPEGLVQGDVSVVETILETALRRRAAIAVAIEPDTLKTRKAKGSKVSGDQVLCAPIGSLPDFVGATYLLRRSRSDEELDELLDACVAMAHLVARALQRFQEEDRGRRSQRLRKALERFHRPDVVEKRVTELTAKDGPLTQMEARQLTAVVADIDGFTELSQQLPADRAAELLNEFYERMTRIVFGFGGTLDKFMGDSVLALFGAPYASEDDAQRALLCALSMRGEWTKAMNRRPPIERRMLQLGVSSGTALVGTVGSDARLDYTAIGEPVNVAAWLAASANPGQLLATKRTLEAVTAKLDLLPVGERLMKKLKKKVALVEVLGEHLGPTTPLTLRR